MVRASSRPVGLLVLLCCLVSVIWHPMSGFSFQSGVGCGFVISCRVQCPSSYIRGRGPAGHAASGVGIRCQGFRVRGVGPASIPGSESRHGVRCAVSGVWGRSPSSSPGLEFIFWSGVAVQLPVRLQHPLSGVGRQNFGMWSGSGHGVGYQASRDWGRSSVIRCQAARFQCPSASLVRDYGYL